MIISRIYFVFILAILLISNVFAFSGTDLKQTDTKILIEYKRLHKEFSRKVCRAKTEVSYWGLQKKFSGNGFYIPLLSKNNKSPQLDIDTIKKMIPKMRSKKSWINKNINKLKQDNQYLSLKQNLRNVEKMYSGLVQLKTDYFKLKTKNDSLRKLTIKEMKKFKNSFGLFVSELEFLQSYNFPVDHLSMRRDYDKFKTRTDLLGIRKSNTIYFERRLVEDGAPRINSNRTDSSLRTILNTVMISVKKQNGFIDENLRYDLKYLFKLLDKRLSDKKSYHIKRLKRWRQKVNERIDFYLSLTNKDNSSVDELLIEKHNYRRKLEEFVLSKQVEVYNYWSKQSILNQYLFSLETILYNEVGSIDGEDGIERRDVGQVVINRSKINFYHTFSNNEELYNKLLNKSDSKNLTHKWLNVLFKKGEFSFTYFFIPATIRVFCPDVSRTGQRLRKENLDIALDLARRPRKKFNAVRYFSRISMLGRINMSLLWNDFEPLPESKGRIINDIDSLVIESYQTGKFDYYYYFLGSDNKLYKVIGINNKTYVVSSTDNKFYSYRNPNFFRFFENM